MEQPVTADEAIALIGKAKTIVEGDMGVKVRASRACVRVGQAGRASACAGGLFELPSQASPACCSIFLSLGRYVLMTPHLLMTIATAAVFHRCRLHRRLICSHQIYASCGSSTGTWLRMIISQKERGRTPP